MLDTSPYPLFIGNKGNNMTPSFYTAFSILQRTLEAFNKKCDCRGVSVTIKFEQTLGTQNSNVDGNLWVANFMSEALGSQRFGGTRERVSELVTEYVNTLSQQTLEACIANADEWFKDKPGVKDAVYDLYKLISNGTQTDG